MSVEEEHTPKPVIRLRAAYVAKPTEFTAVQQMQAIEKGVGYIIRGIKAQSADALVEALRPIYEESQVLVPVKTGKLKASGYLEGENTSNGAKAQVGYSIGYAVYVHENLEAYHEPPTQAKFLQQPMEEQRAEIRGRVVEYLRTVMGQN